MPSITAKQVGKRKEKNKPAFVPKEIQKEAQADVATFGKQLSSWSVGFIDIETTGLAADFGFILGACIKPSGSKKILEFRIDSYPDYRKDLCDDHRLVMDIKEAMSQFDVLIHFNGNDFDMPFIDTRLAIWGEKRSPLVHDIDLLPIVRKKLRLHSRRLDAVATALQVKHEKTKLDPMVWQRASHGSTKDLDYIMEHCRMDVVVLEEVFVKLKGFVDAIFRRR